MSSPTAIVEPPMHHDEAAPEEVPQPQPPQLQPQPHGQSPPAPRTPSQHSATAAAASEEAEAEPRGTCAPSAVPAHPAHPLAVEEADAEVEAAEEAAVAAYEEELREEAEAEAEAEEAAEEAAAEAADTARANSTAPAAQVATARPHEAGKTPKPKKAAKGPKKAAAAPKAPASPSAAAKAPAPRKKKPAYKVSIATVERHAPVPEGVTTPRSVALCKQQGINPTELAPYPLDHFKGAGVSDEVAELRYNSYEKRRQARMEALTPAYKAVLKESADEAAAEAKETAAAPAAAAQEAPAAPVATGALDEDAAMQRQFEAQHQRLLEQERRKTGGSGYDADGRRRSGHSHGGSPKSPSRFSVSPSVGGRTAIDQPYSAAKIISASMVEERPLTVGEAIMIEEINEREARRIDTQERAYVIQENKQLMQVQRGLEREVRTSTSVQKKAEEREKRQEEMYLRRASRQAEVAERRRQLEAERQIRVEERVAEKQARVHASDPYASVASRRLSGSPGRRASDNAPPHEGAAAGEPQPVEAAE